MKALNPKNQSLLDKAVAMAAQYKDCVALRMVWESNIKQIQNAKHSF